jgi:membrane protein implicated in regulation of membrane protease activity
MDWLGDHVAGVWLALAILLGIAEMFSLDLILLMLALGALVGMVTALLGAGLAVSAIAAAVASVACLAVVRPPLVKRLHTGPELSLGHGKLVGKQGIVTERITHMESGRVKLAGEIWSAKPYDETLIIEPGATVEVLEIRGATAYVHPVPSLES